MHNYLINLGPVLLGAPLQLGALSARLVRLWVYPALRLDLATSSTNRAPKIISPICSATPVSCAKYDQSAVKSRTAYKTETGLLTAGCSQLQFKVDRRRDKTAGKSLITAETCLRTFADLCV